MNPKSTFDIKYDDGAVRLKTFYSMALALESRDRFDGKDDRAALYASIVADLEEYMDKA